MALLSDFLRSPSFYSPRDSQPCTFAVDCILFSLTSHWRPLIIGKADCRVGGAGEGGYCNTLGTILRGKGRSRRIPLISDKSTEIEKWITLANRKEGHQKLHFRDGEKAGREWR